MIGRLFFLSFAFAAFVQAEETWQVVRVGRVDYVSLDSFAKFYGFKIPGQIEPNQPFVLSSSFGNLTMTLDSRELKWKGSRYWLSH